MLTRERLSKFVGRELNAADMAKWLPWLGFDIEEVGADYVKAEFNPNRIDFCSYTGVARAFKGLRGWEVGLPKYVVRDGKIVLNIDKAVSSVRPYMLAAVVRGMQLDVEDVADLMEMQEDLHWGIGRDRKKASIGVHNLDAVKPPFTYTAVKPDSVRFVPLDKTDEMSLEEILEKHEKGMAYKHLVDWAPKYPLLIDRNGRVLSMPPIINGELTRVDERTRNLFLDVTGADYAAVERSLNILTTALADMGGTVERVRVNYHDRTVFSPDLKPQKAKFHTAYAEELLGIRLSESKAIECLKKCRLGARNAGKGVVDVEIPAYRIDILHEVDLVEEAAIGYGYYRLKPTFPRSVTIGERHRTCVAANRARQVMIGLGFTEVVNFTLTNENLHYDKMRKRLGKPIKLANPVSSEYTIMRQDLLPNLMKNLAENRHENFPQRLFEASDVVWLNSRQETGCERRLHLAAVSSHVTAGFTEMRSTVEAFVSNIGVKVWKISATAHPSFIEGRAAAINVKNKQIGIVGEVHPQVLNNFVLENPTSAFEVDLEALIC
jgi:phenylalanyl-tRNA synthetase beta chain